MAEGTVALDTLPVISGTIFPINHLASAECASMKSNCSQVTAQQS